MADEVYRLQTGRDAECVLFQKIAEQGHYAGRVFPSSTRQGIYAAAPSGVLLASINSTDPVRVAEMLERGLARWKELPREERLGAEVPPVAETDVRRCERYYPEGGLALRVNARDLPREGAPQQQAEQPGRDWRTTAWNQDYAWFKREEARQFLPEKPGAGQKHEVPAPLIRRIVRFHLVDNVRGQTEAYADAHVERASLTSEVLSLEGNVVTLKLTGETRATATGMWSVGGLRRQNERGPQKRGFETRLLGTAKYDLARKRFTAFEMLALGTRWGGTQFNGRGNDLDPAPIGVALTLAGDSPTERVAPAFFRGYDWQ